MYFISRHFVFYSELFHACWIILHVLKWTGKSSDYKPHYMWSCQLIVVFLTCLGGFQSHPCDLLQLFLSISINDFTHILLVHVKTTMQIVPFLAKLLWDKRIVNFLINLLWSRTRYHQFWIKIYAIFEKVLHPLSWDG